MCVVSMWTPKILFWLSVDNGELLMEREICLLCSCVSGVERESCVLEGLI